MIDTSPAASIVPLLVTDASIVLLSAVSLPAPVMPRIVCVKSSSFLLRTSEYAASTISPLSVIVAVKFWLPSNTVLSVVPALTRSVKSILPVLSCAAESILTEAAFIPIPFGAKTFPLTMISPDGLSGIFISAIFACSAPNASASIFHAPSLINFS